jgi:hypothetical protein
MLLSEAKQILKKSGYLLEFTEGRYCIMNKNTGKYFTGVGANGKCFPWTDAIKPRERNAFSITESRKDEARLSNKQKTLAELEEYFGISADGDTIYTDILSREDEIEIGNICDKYNVDFSLGSKHVTVYDKTRNEAFIQDDRGSVDVEDLAV